MRRMSFAMTSHQLLDGSKTVTRRLGWKSLRTGDTVKAVSKVMGFRKGERAQVYGTCEIVSVRREPIDAITDADVLAEGFPGKDAAWFVEFFCKAMRVRPDQLCTRIEFRFSSEPVQPTLF